MRSIAAAPLQRTASPTRGKAGGLWDAYRAGNDQVARDRLVLHYAGLVTYLATRIRSDLPGNVEYSDLIQSGLIGLMDAVARFDPDQGVQFETFAVSRIRGAILDELRAYDWAPRSVRRNARDIAAAMEDCYRRLQRTPSAAEISDTLHVSLDELHRMRAEVGRARLSSLDEMLWADDGAGDDVLDPFAEQPGGALDDRATSEELRSALDRLPLRHRAVLMHYYVEGLTLAQIGRLLGVTESRASQLRTAALEKLRIRLSSTI